MSRFIEYIVPPQDDGLTVKQILKHSMGLSRAFVSRLKPLDDGITLGGERVTVRAVARAGQVVRVLRDVPRGSPAAAVPGELNIVFEDEHLLILSKPAGLVVHPSRGHFGDTLANRMAHYLGTQAPPRFINRIDKGTSGLLCAAKSAYSAQALSRQLISGEIEREYLAVVSGILPDKGTIDAPIARAAGIAREVREGGQKAVTHFWKMREGNGRTLVRVRLETGRTHQIRVHFAHTGAPVCGDFMYGTELDWLDGHALHSAKMRLRLPSGQAREFEAPAPDYFEKLLTSSAKCHASSKSTTIP